MVSVTLSIGTEVFPVKNDLKTVAAEDDVGMAAVFL